MAGQKRAQDLMDSDDEPGDSPDQGGSDQGGSDQGGSEEGYSDPGAYSNADGSIGHSGTMSGEPPDHSDITGEYEASSGAALAVLGIGIEVVAGGIAESLGSPGFGFGLMVADMVIEASDAIFGEPVEHEGVDDPTDRGKK